MSVLLVCPYGRGGIYYYACCLAEALLDRGLDVRLLAPSTAEICEPLDSRRVIERGLASFDSAAPVGFAPTRRLRSLAGHLRNVRSVYRLASDVEAQVVHFLWPMLRLPTLAILAVKRAKRQPRTVLTVHNAFPHDTDPAAMAKRLAVLYRQADSLVVHTDGTAADLREWFGEGLASKSTVIRMGVALRDIATDADRKDARERLGLPADAFIVLAPGGIREYKGLPVLVEAVARLESSSGAMLVVAGDGPAWPEARTLIRQLGVEDRVVERIGWVSQSAFRDYMLAADLVALPYKHIWGSAVAAEAAAHHVPLMMSRIDGFTESWPEETVKYVEGGAAEWGAAIALAEANREILQRCVIRMDAHLTASCSWAASARDHSSVYRKLWNERV